jgi:two-component system cell cycle response regulator
MLEKEDYKVIEAESGEECLNKLKIEKPDLILLDVMMPGLDGWEISKIIKEDKKTGHIPIAMFTVRTRKEDKTKSLQYACADKHIDKPAGKEELISTIKSLLETYREGNGN